MAAMILSDVTRKKQAEEEYEKNRDALSSSEARFRSIVETANEGIVLVDEKMNITYGNQKLSEMSGYSPDEFMGRSVFEFLKNKERNRFKRILIKINQQQRNNFDISIQRKSGQTVKVLVNASIIRGDNGKNQGYLALITDISARYDIEKDLKKTKKKLEIALNNGKIGTWEWNIRTNEVVWDSRMHEMFNLKPGTFGGTFSHFEECVHEEDVHHIRDAIRQTLLDGKPYEVVYRTSPVNGKSHYIASKALLMRSNKGNPLCLSGVAFDITDMKEGAEKVLIKTNEELLRSNSDLRQFAAVASHDLQEPLRMIASYTQLLKQKYSASLDEDAIDYINYAVDGSKRMYEMINGLLAYSRVNSRGVEFKPVDMNRVLDRVKENLKFALGSANAVIMSDKLPVIIADENQIIQLLQNLIENSVKFSKTTPRIEISCEKAGSNFVFSLKDNGIGIENQYFERIFRIFQKLHTREVYSGSGIGLAICRRIIERHSGKIWVKSEEGKGSTFCFTIPVR
jgi:PAS domain S-box-containing protein